LTTNNERQVETKARLRQKLRDRVETEAKTRRLSWGRGR